MLSEDGRLSLAGSNGMQLLEAVLFCTRVNVLCYLLKVTADMGNCGEQFVRRYCRPAFSTHID